MDANNFNQEDRALVVLASYDAKALYLTLLSLNETVSDDETIVIILNGKRGIRSAQVEEVARQWCAGHKRRFVVRPLNYGGAPYESIHEVLDQFAPLKNKGFICKMDDDIIPLRKGWLENLHLKYMALEKSQPVGFVTPLINNNAWGFAQLLDIFDKKEEFALINNFYSTSGEGVVDPCSVADGLCGTVWQYPYLAKWCHEWTLLDVENFIEKTQYLPEREIPLGTHYSIGCIFFRKNLWGDVLSINQRTNFDELSLHLFCQQHSLPKFAVMSEPVGHLFYFVQRKANANLISMCASRLASFWGNKNFLDYPKYDMETFMMMELEEFHQGQQEVLSKKFDEVCQKQQEFFVQQLNDFRQS